MKNKAVNLLCGVLAFVCLWDITPGLPTIPWLKVDESAPSSVVFEDNKDIEFNLTVEGSPLPDCEGWYRDLGNNKLAKQDTKRFQCDPDNSTERRVFNLKIPSPTIVVLGKYVIIFINSEGIQLFDFEIKAEKDGWWPETVIITAFVVAGVVVIIIFIITIVACRKRCCRQDDNRRRRLTNQSSSSGRTSRPLSMNPFSTLTRRSTRNRPTPPPKPPQDSRHSYEPPSSLTALDPCASKPCACGTGSTLHTGYVRMDGSVYTEEEEIADAITSTLQRFMKRPRNNTTTTPFESNLMKSRRMSRSVPSLYNSGLPAHNMTLPSRRVHPCPSMPPGYSTIRGGYALPGMSEDEGGCNAVMPRGFYPRQHRPSSGSAVDSGWDDMSDFASVSVAAESTAMRRVLLPLNEDSRNYKKFWRRSEVIYSADLGSEASNPYQEALSPHRDDDDTLRHSENKYVCMSEYYQGPMSLPNPPMDSFPQLPLPPPPPPLKPIPPPKPCVTKDRPYQNLMNNCLKPYDPAGENDDCEDCEQGFFCR